MYPEVVHFERVEPGPAGVLIEWEELNGHPIEHVDLWVSAVAIAPDESEAFYRGELRHRMRCFRFPGGSRAFTDPDPGDARWVAVFGVTSEGDLVAVPFQVRSLDGLVALPSGTRGDVEPSGGTGRLDAPPELVFRDDDPKARITIRASAAAMARG